MLDGAHGKQIVEGKGNERQAVAFAMSYFVVLLYVAMRLYPTSGERTSAELVESSRARRTVLRWSSRCRCLTVEAKKPASRSPVH